MSRGADGDTMEAVLVLRVKPRAKRAGLVGWHGEALKLAVRAAPERGRANDEVLSVLAAALGVPVATLVLEAGAASQDKRVRVRGLAAPEVRRRLRAALGSPAGSEEPSS
jgi:uncharacterized protein (TIGR00251 family)